MASSIVFPVYFVFSAMYPSLVVVFVDKKTSVVEIFITSMAQETAGLDSGSHERRAATFGHLSFASVGSQKTTDSSEFMHHLGNEETLTTDPLLPRHISVCDSNV
ncbi:hypothetical protein H2248_008812 [Termitomyces sp. 'cryptogamus']|nr:hypothetical protein H2248_008812 [Termitomyces sp. 'cryptogamus']